MYTQICIYIYIYICTHTHTHTHTHIYIVLLKADSANNSFSAVFLQRMTAVVCLLEVVL